MFVYDGKSLRDRTCKKCKDLSDARASISASGRYVVFYAPRKPVLLTSTGEGDEGMELRDEPQKSNQGKSSDGELIQGETITTVDVSEPDAARANADIFLGSREGILRRVSIDDGGQLAKRSYAQVAENVTSLAVDSGTSLLAVGTPHQAFVLAWGSMAEHKPDQSVSAINGVPLVHQGAVSQISFVREKNTPILDVLTVSDDHNVRLFDALSGRERMRWSEDEGNDAIAARAWATEKGVYVAAITRSATIGHGLYKPGLYKPNSPSNAELLEPAETWFNGPDKNGCNFSILAGKSWIAGCPSGVILDGHPKIMGKHSPELPIEWSSSAGEAKVAWIAENRSSVEVGTVRQGELAARVAQIPLKLSLPTALLSVDAGGWIALATVNNSGTPIVQVAQAEGARWTSVQLWLPDPSPPPSFSSLFIADGCKGKLVLAGTRDGKVYSSTKPSEDILRFDVNKRKPVVSLRATATNECEVDSLWAGLDDGTVLYQKGSSKADADTLLQPGERSPRLFMGAPNNTFVVIEERPLGGSDMFLFTKRKNFGFPTDHFTAMFDGRKGGSEFELAGRLGSPGYFSSVKLDSSNPQLVTAAVLLPQPDGSRRLGKETHNFDIAAHVNEMCDNLTRPTDDVSHSCAALRH